jgi:hypothetical protein
VTADAATVKKPIVTEALCGFCNTGKMVDAGKAQSSFTADAWHRKCRGTVVSTNGNVLLCTCGCSWDKVTRIRDELDTATAANAAKPKPERTPRKRAGRTPQECACGCKGMTKGGTWLPGHDARRHGKQSK